MPVAKKDTPAKAEPEAKKPAAKADPEPEAEAEVEPEAEAEVPDKTDPVEPTGVLNHADLAPSEQAKIREPNG